jgi:hypothetical protein
MKRMKLLLFLAAGLAFAADLESVHKVYLMPMSRGMDQYLASRLVSEHVFEVVTDPKLADAIFTERLGEAFETQLEDLSPKKAAEPAAKPVQATPGSFAGETANKLSNPALTSSFGRAKGTLFLVDAKSRAVVWSVYDPPRDFNGRTLDRTAGSMVDRLKRDLNPKKKDTGR